MHVRQTNPQPPVREEVRELVAELERRGYDRRTAINLLLDIADKGRSDPPKRFVRSRSAESDAPFPL